MLPRVRFAQVPPRFSRDEAPGIVDLAVFLAWARAAEVLHVAQTEEP